ncbi:MAG: ABC transporter permease [Candidatus Latescibacteria bacterium]|nr:ABC transporter permease [Candidatus Latescibacterota bacterium]
MARSLTDDQTLEATPTTVPGTWRLLLRNRTATTAGLMVLSCIIIATFAPVLAPHEPAEQHPGTIRLPPFWALGGSFQFPLGTDALGRDLLSRIMYGARVSILLGLVVVALTLVIGTGLGMLAGYYGGWFDAVMSRVVDTLLAFPFLIFALAIMAATGPNLVTLIVALAFKGWVDFFRVARGDVMAARESEYVLAARGLGTSNAYIIFGEILPNIVPPLIVLATLRTATIIISEASLSFLGIGVPPSIPAWGTMIADGRGDIASAWWIATFPGLAILLLVLSVNLFGEGLRDALDPRMRRR